MATKLNFTKEGSRWICEMTPSVPFVAQVQMKEKKDFTVYGFIGDMPPVALYATSLYDNIIFQVDVPDGVTVLMVTSSEVLNAQVVEES